MGKSRRKDENDLLISLQKAEPALLILVAGLVLVAPLFRGLFFPAEQMIAFYGALALAIIMVLAGYFRLGGLNALDLSLLALIAAFVLSTIGAVAPRAAVQFLITQLTFLALYWAVSRLGRRPEYRRWIVEILAFAPLLLALIGLGAAVGWVKYPSAVEGHRISSTLQYYNSLAAYLTAGLVFVAALRVGDDLPVWRRLYFSLIAYCALVATIFTYSRGGWLVLPLVILALFLLVPASRRQALVLTSLAPVFGALVTAVLFEPGFKANNSGLMLNGLLVGAAVAIALDRAADWVLKRTAGRERLVWAVIAGLAVVTLAIASVNMPAGVIQRITQINFMDMSVQERLTFYRDAFKIIKDNPILGIGGAGWASIFMSYQSYGYYSTQVHSWLMQVWLEGGTLALGALLMAVGSFAAMYFRLRKLLAPADGLLLTGAAVGSGTIFLHSLIDFNLSLAGLTLFLTALIALARSFEVESELRAAKTSRGSVAAPPGPGAFEVGLLAVIILATLANTSLLLGFRHGQTGLGHIKVRRYVEARREFLKATIYDPLQASYWLDLGNSTMTAGLNERNTSLMREGWSSVQKGLSLEPWDPKLRRAAATGALSIGMIEEGLTEMEMALKRNPHTAARYEEMAQALYLGGDAYLKRNQKEMARKKFEQALAVPQKMKEVSAAVRAPWAGMDQLLPPQTEPLNLIVSKSMVMLGLTHDAGQWLKTVTAPALVDEARVWMALNLERQGRNDEAGRILEVALRNRPDLIRVLEQVRPGLRNLP